MRDFEIRTSLHNDFLTNYNNFPESIVVDELKVCNGEAIMDIAVINGSLIGYEIKSPNDNLQRLSRQVTFYSKVFDYVTIVTCDKHLQGILREVPTWWGIWVLNKDEAGVKKIQMRTPSANDQIEGFSIAQFLWKSEIIDLINKYGLDRKVCSKRKWMQWQYLAEALELHVLKKEVRSYLKARIG